VQHFGEEGGVVPVIDVAATSTFLKPEDMERTFAGELAGCYLYSRHSNPTVAALGKKIAAMEGTEAALGVSSGMAAIASTLEQLMDQGGHLVASRWVYGGTYALLKNLFPRRGWSVSWVDPSDLEAVSRAIGPKTRAVYVETLSNPLLQVADIPKLAAICRARDVKLVVDNTFAPLLVRPAAWGADLVVHSCTKYISGSSDCIAGAIAGSQEFIASLTDVNQGSVMLTGPVMDARVAHELYLRLDHLALRMRGHSESALFLARKMEASGLSVIYPGLTSHPGHELLRSLSHPGLGYGGMLVLDCGDADRALRLASRLQEEKFGLYAVSLGFSRTLMSCPARSTSSEIPEAERESMRLSPGLLRFSVGYTGDDETLWGRFERCHREVLSK
jgi:methionine-gamma-lyase